ncbi:MAG: glycosyltransferase family 2 protein [Gammaproteobacteria bacterium]|nr:glycosyltransferase family 2 protein [Gammaproteobacteria bacterium]MDH3535462.1 glycosyltransferase family 2 protein [Gammaproteobacteria bacterium]
MLNEQQNSTPTLDVSIVIPAFKRPELLRKALISALAQDLAPEKFEVIVVDSSPDDNNAAIVEALKQESGRVALTLYRKAPEGPGPSRLLGAHRARGRIVAYLDSDCQATPGWLAAGLARFDQDIGIVQGRTLPVPGQPIGVFSRYVQIEAENPRYEAANIFYRRDCLAEFDEASKDLTPNDERPTGGEDALMAWRVKRNGWQSTFADEALVYHEVIAISIWHWFYEKRMIMLPWLVREVPEMKGVFYLRYFHDRAHACLVLLLAGVVLSPLSLAWLAAAIPYFVLRASESSNRLRGIMRLTRGLIYLPRDLIAFGLLVVGSLRYQTLLL